MTKTLWTLQESDTTWTAPDGTVIPMHRIDIRLPYDTPFMYDWATPEGTIRRHIVTGNSLADLRSEYPEEFAVALGETDLDHAEGQGFKRAIRKMQEKFYLSETTESRWGHLRIHALEIRAILPDRQTGEFQQMNFFGMTPKPLTWADLRVFAPTTALK